ncbi:hypothetical protein CUMW_240460, partial [Citrus unshiu]
MAVEVSLNGALLYLKNLYVFFFIAWRQWILIGWSEKGVVPLSVTPKPELRRQI